MQTTRIKQKVTQKKGRLLSTYNHYVVENNKQYCYYYINNIGKTIFLTREEAEKALKDMRNKENEKEDIT